jgi:hypothetical protein
MKKNIVRILGMSMLAVIIGCATQQQNNVVVEPDTILKGAPYTCKKATDKMVVDGVLNEQAWKDAVRIEKFYPYSPKDATKLSGTRARLTWDDKNLYVAIECADDDVWSYSNKADDDLWRGDVAEFFVKPSTSMPAYCEFVISPAGGLYDARYPSRGAGGLHRFKGWSSNAKVATKINGSDGNWKDTDTGYIVEMAIPFTAFKEFVKVPAAGDVWNFGVCRYDYTKSYESTLLLMTMPESKKNGYHYYEAYSPLLFK